MRGAVVSAAGRWFITPHAVGRYQRRWRRSSTYEQCLSELISLSETAREIKKLQNGQDLYLYRGPGPARLCCLVSKSGTGLPQLVTVLPRHDGRHA